MPLPAGAPRTRRAIRLLPRPAAAPALTPTRRTPSPSSLAGAAGAQAPAGARRLRRHRAGLVRRAQPAPAAAGGRRLPRAARVQPDGRRHGQRGRAAARLSRSGRLPAHAVALAPARSRRALAGVAAGAGAAALAALLALLLLAATPVAASKPWQRLEHLGPDRSEPVAPRLQLDAQLPEPSRPQDQRHGPRRVESPLASYWRANALESFNGEAWLSGGSSIVRLIAEGAPDPATYDVPAAGPDPPGTTVAELFKIQSLSTDFLFTGGAPNALIVLSGARPVLQRQRTGAAARATRWDHSSRYAAHRRDPPAQGRRPRRPRSRLPGRTSCPTSRCPSRRRPAADSAPQGRVARRHERQPRRPRVARPLPARTQAIVGRATDPYQITLRIEQYLRAHYSYSLTPPQTRYASPYAAFLFATKTGYCQHFAGAMAAARAVQRDTRPRGSRLHDRRAGGQGHVRRRPQRRPRLGRGLLPRRRLGALRAHARQTACRGPAPRRRTPDSSIPSPSDAGPAAPAAAAAAAAKLQRVPGRRAGRRASASQQGPRGALRDPGLAALGPRARAALLVWPFAPGRRAPRGLRRGQPRAPPASRALR